MREEFRGLLRGDALGFAVTVGLPSRLLHRIVVGSAFGQEGAETVFRRKNLDVDLRGNSGVGELERFHDCNVGDPMQCFRDSQSELEKGNFVLPGKQQDELGSHSSVQRGGYGLWNN